METEAARDVYRKFQDASETEYDFGIDYKNFNTQCWDPYSTCSDSSDMTTFIDFLLYLRTMITLKKKVYMQ